MQQQRRRMAAADHLDFRMVVGDVEDQRGDEVLTEVVLGVGDPLEVAVDAVLEGGRQRGQRVAARALPERAQHHRRLGDGAQALAPDVADQHAARGSGRACDREQVAADLALVLGRQVQPGDPQRADAPGRRPQQGELRGLGHGPRPAQRPLAALPDQAQEVAGPWHPRGRRP
nr:hypothetical protein [Actinomadura physcomitrii]